MTIFLLSSDFLTSATYVVMSLLFLSVVAFVASATEAADRFKSVISETVCVCSVLALAPRAAVRPLTFACSMVPIPRAPSTPTVTSVDAFTRPGVESVATTRSEASSLLSSVVWRSVTSLMAWVCTLAALPPRASVKPVTLSCDTAVMLMAPSPATAISEEALTIPAVS